jgi:GTP-binding protein EngB required for normal cell division
MDIAGRVADIAGTANRSDLADRLRVAVARTARPATIICVVGEFKQGKSSLVNALLGRHVCPVDDDLATSAITLVRHGDQPSVEVRRRVDGELVVEQVPNESITDWVTEAGNPDNAKNVERVDVSLPNPLLADGLVIVDTPGMGSMGAGHAAATLAFLPFADGLVFVSDASAELSEPEVDFLKRARDLCPNVVVVLTKTDLYPHWREIRELDIRHLERIGCAAPVGPLSAAMRWAASDHSDRELLDRSGYPALLAHLQATVIRPAKAVAADRAMTEAFGALEQLRAAAEGELSVIDDPGRLALTLEQADQAKVRLEHLRGPASRWSILVGDRIADLTNDVTFRYRGDMRRIVRALEDSIEEIKKPTDWDDLARVLQTEVADAVTDAFMRMDRGGEEIKEAVVELVAEEALQLPPLPTRSSDAVDVMTLWSAKPIDPKSGKAGAALGSTLTGLRGAQSGIIMFGMMGQFLPSGVAVLMMSNPVTLGLGAAFGGMQLLDAHKRKITQRRQTARANVRQFADDVQFEVGNQITEALRLIQRALRDEFTERIAELQRTYAQTAQQAQETAKADGAAQQARGAELRAALDELTKLNAATVALQGHAA